MPKPRFENASREKHDEGEKDPTVMPMHHF